METSPPRCPPPWTSSSAERFIDSSTNSKRIPQALDGCENHASVPSAGVMTLASDRSAFSLR
jgi:hypothetical protein